MSAAHGPTPCRRPERIFRGLGVASIVAAAIALPGCYRHVVGVKGNTPTNVEVHEANVSKEDSFWAQPEARRVNRPLPIAPPAPTSTAKPGS